MKFLLAYLRQHRVALLAFVLCSAIFLLVFDLYHVPVMAAVYPVALSMLLLAGFAAVDLRRAWRKHRQMERLCKLPSECLEELPPADSLSEKDYQALLVMLKGESERRKRDMELRYADMVDYYTVWAHQIKTPIASIRLNQQNEDSEFSRQVAEDLQRIEQYVQMALEVLTEEIRVRQARVEYKKSAVYGDEIFPKVAREEGRTVVELCDIKGKPYAVVELIGE